MPLNKDFANRIEIIDDCLRNNLRKWTLQDLIDAVNDKLQARYGKTVSKRTIQADLQYLKEEKEAPIKKKNIGTTIYFYYSDINFSLKNPLINNEEINYLADAINILRQVNDFKILKDVEEVVEKLQNTVNSYKERSASLIQFERHTTSLGSQYIDDIYSAIKGEISLRISYQSFKALQTEEFVFHCYLLKEYRNRWFVIGRKEGNLSLTTLALDRIKCLRNSAVRFIQNDLFNTETYFNNMIGVSLPDNAVLQNIDIRIKKDQVPYILTKPIHNSQKIIEEHKSGDILIRLYLIVNYELRSVLLSYGADIEVICPDSLRKIIKEILQNASNNYT